MDDYWKEVEFSLFADFPIYRKDEGIKMRSINFQNGIGYKKIFDKRSEVNSLTVTKTYYEDDKYNYPLYFSINALSIEQKAIQDMTPTFSRLSLIYNRTIGNSNYEGIQSVISFSTGINLGNKTGLLFDIQYEENKNNGYEFVNYIQQLSVIDDIVSPERFRIKTTVKKHLFYPDIDFLYLLYVKRLYLDVSMDLLNCNNYIFFSPIFGIGLTTEIGGILDYKIHLPVTIHYYRNLIDNIYGFGISFN